MYVYKNNFDRSRLRCLERSVIGLTLRERRTQSRTARLETRSIKAQAGWSQSSILDGLIDLPCRGQRRSPSAASSRPSPLSRSPSGICLFALWLLAMPFYPPLFPCRPASLHTQAARCLRLLDAPWWHDINTWSANRSHAEAIRFVIVAVNHLLF